nr:NADH-quinone oxidoreductase subunit H [Xylanimonas allomyrinae]
MACPWPLSAINDGMFNEGWWPILWFLAKVWILMFMFVWVRGTLLRLRYDQFMVFGWKVLIPVALGWLVFLSVVQYGRLAGSVSRGTLVGVITGVGVVVVALATFWPERRKQPDDAAPATFDAFAGGYPVPPLPGQTLPPSPRAARRPVTVDATPAGAPAGAPAGTAGSDAEEDAR